MLIKDLFGLRKTTGDLGLELEVESNRAWPEVLPVIEGWIPKRDGSLRVHGMEFVTDGAVKVDQKSRSISNLTTFLSNYPILQDSPRTSFHVHVNVQHLSLTQTAVGLFMAYLMDNLMMRMCGRFREGNQYCLRYKDAEGIADYVSELFRSASWGSWHEDVMKYSSVNIYTMRRLGTIEFRGMRGITDAPGMDNWSSICYHTIHGAVKAFQTPQDLLDAYTSKSKRDFLSMVYPSHIVNQFTSIFGWEDLIEENEIVAMKFCLYHNDWGMWEKAIDEKQSLKKTKKSSFDVDAYVREVDAIRARDNAINLVVTSNQGIARRA